ncbi:MAG: phytoene/squalene synthase family protein [Chthoniobacterales bacterium]|nr:phytoene/squalene synthase family protein [Chthoniobacterales bacterium]
MTSSHSQHFLALRSNLGIALYLLPSALRGDALLFYHFCQRLDHCIDDASYSQPEKQRLLDQLLLMLEEQKKRGATKLSSPLLSTQCAAMFSRRNLSYELLYELIGGMQMDLTTNRYATFEELYLYAWRVASTVGLLSAHLFEAEGAAVQEYAETLGIALQLTNILRDVAEDATRNRIYLPLEDFERFRVTEKELLQGILSPQAIHLFDYAAQRALSFFGKTERTWEKMSAAERRTMRAARLMETIYRALLKKMRDDRYDLFYRRYHVGMGKKLSLMLQLFFYEG